MRCWATWRHLKHGDLWFDPDPLLPTRTIKQGARLVKLNFGMKLLEVNLLCQITFLRALAAGCLKEESVPPIWARGRITQAPTASRSPTPPTSATPRRTLSPTWMTSLKSASSGMAWMGSIPL